VRLLALALAAFALAGCESSQEKNAQLARIYRREARQAARRKALTQPSLEIIHPSRALAVRSASVLHSSEGAAAVVVVHNSSSSAIRDAPIRITVADDKGKTLYTNALPGLAGPLVTVPLVPAHGTSTWVNDQVQSARVPARVSAELGEGERTAEPPPRLAVLGAHLGEGGVEGSLVNHGSATEHEVVLYALARRGGAIVAAGSAIVPQAEPSVPAHFQAFLVGDARGARLEVDVGGPS
jgi:hypothetical protein